LDSNIGSELIVTLAWRSAEVAAICAALMMLIALLVRQHIRREDRLRARVVDSWRPAADPHCDRGRRPAAASGDPPA
jgi:hypothetical protein